MESSLVTFIASVLVWVMVAGVIYLWLFRRMIPRNQVFRIFLAGIVAWTVSDLIKTIFPTPRPFVAEDLVSLTITTPRDPSFPSIHSSWAFAIATSLRNHDKKVFVLFILFASLVGLGRVVSHVHYSIDVLAGAFIGVLTVIFIEKVNIAKIQKMFNS